MALLALHAFTFLLFENDDLLAAFVFEDRGGDAGSVEERGADAEAFAFTDGEDLVDLNGGAGFGIGIAVNDQDIAFGNGELLALCFDGRFHKIKGRTK